MKFFQHSYQLRDEPRVAQLLTRMGYEGYGLFLTVVEEIRKGGGSTPLSHLQTLTNKKTNRLKLDRLLQCYDLFTIDPQGQVSLKNLRLNEYTEEDPRQLKLNFENS